MTGTPQEPQGSFDGQYAGILLHLLNEGVHSRHPHQDKSRITSLTTANMVFNLADGFPMIPNRDVSKFWRRPIAELIAFINGARTLEQLKEYGGKYWASWWDRWATEEKCRTFGLPPGDLGPGSYGPGFVRVQRDGTTFNQVEHLVQEIRDMPGLSTHRITPWIPELTLQHHGRKRQVVVAPCHGDVQVTILGGKLHLRMDQRSGDVPVGVPSNMIQWAAFALMLAQVTGYEPGLFIHSIHDAHMYSDQVERVKELVGRVARPLPTVRITRTDVTNIFDFRPEDFEVEGYHPLPAMEIPVTE